MSSTSAWPVERVPGGSGRPDGPRTRGLRPLVVELAPA